MREWLFNVMEELAGRGKLTPHFSKLHKEGEVNFMFYKKATKFDKIFTFNMTVCCNFQIDGEDFLNFCGLLRKSELKKIIYIIDFENNIGNLACQTLSSNSNRDLILHT